MTPANILPFRNAPYVPTGYVRLPEVPPEPQKISAHFAFWIGVAAGGAAVGMTVALMVPH